MYSLRKFILLLLLPLGVLYSAERAASWKVQQSLGSTQLSLFSINQIILPVDADKKLIAAAKDLKSVYAERVAKDLDLNEQASAPVKRSIILSLREPFDSTGGFMINRQRTQIIIEAASQEGLVNGIYAFCADVLGARWYWSGDYGLEYVGEVPLTFPAKRWDEVPAFKQRRLSPMNTDYGRRNRLNYTFEFNHALAKVFSPQRFEDTPEVFSVVNGRQRVPKGSGGTDRTASLSSPVSS